MGRAKTYGQPPAYAPPVDRLLTTGDPRPFNSAWHDYRVRFGLSESDVPALLRMLVDPDLYETTGKTVWASMHAWRALAQLGPTPAAVGPLLSLLPRIAEFDDDWIGEEVPHVFGVVGGPAVDPLGAYLLDRSNDLYARVAVAGGLRAVAERHPAERERCVGRLLAALGGSAAAPASPVAAASPAAPADSPDDAAARAEADEGSLRGFVVSDLLDLNAVEQADAIRAAFDAGRVDEQICGDWEYVQEELGLKPARPLGTPRGFLSRSQRNLLGRAVDAATPGGGRVPV